jgi:feruloyl esterase
MGWNAALIVIGLSELLFPFRICAQMKTCEDLSTKINLAGIVIENAELVAAGSPLANSNPAMPPLPANWKFPEYCKVHGSIHARIGADNAKYAIQFELRMPNPWNGKFLFQGGGGLDGVVQPAMGVVGFNAPPALVRGYAVASTDSGHQGFSNSIFGHEQQARLDYAYNAIGEVARAAKAVLSTYYGKSEEHSYFAGCSNGGREAMMAVERYPLEFDGAIAGDPGFNLSHAAIGEAWDTETFAAIAPRGEDGRPILSKAFSQADLDLVRKAVLDECDGLDGVKDGEINNFKECNFNPGILLCGGVKTADCLSKEQVDALRRSFSGARDSSGRQIYASWPYDAGIAGTDWRGWKLGSSTNSTPNAVNTTMGAIALKDYFVHPYLADFDPAHVEFDKISGEVEETHAINDAVSTDLGTFAKRGGKLIVYEGLSDPVFSANDIVAYFDQLATDNGGQQNAQSIARLFLIPGMNHCGGGPSTDQFDALDALEKWVEAGKPPASILASGRAFPHRTRPLCPYPKFAFYKGSGDPEEAANFVCK